MTVFNSPPPLPARVLPLRTPLPPPLPASVPLKPTGSRGYHGVSVVVMFAFFCWLPVGAATMYLMWSELISGNGGFFSGHLILMIGRVFIVVLALMMGVIHCQYAL